MTKNAVHLTHAAEIWSTDPGAAGPTGDFAMVVRGEVRDHGGNVLFAGTATECAFAQKRLRVPSRLCPTEWREVGCEVTGADYLWQLVCSPNS